jgi:phytoene dehydrogenase-like protein
MKKIIIIGGGVSGISAGIYAREAGFNAEIFEKNQTAGGQCMGWNRKKHHIDNCIHWLTGTKKGTSLRNVWEEVGALESDTEFVDDDNFYTSYVGNQGTTLWRDLERTEKELLELSPEDEIEIKKFITHVKYATCCEMPADKPMDMMGIKDYIKMGKSMAHMPKVIKEYGGIDLQDLSDRFKNPVIKALMTDYLPKEYQASSFIVSYATVACGNGDVPAGGSLAMVNRMLKKYQDLGGIIHCGSPVKKVCLEGNKASGIELLDGSIHEADYVLLATDAMEAFEKLLGNEHMDKKWKKSFSDVKKYPLFSGLQMAFSIDKSAYPYSGTIFFDCKPIQIGSKNVRRMFVKSFEYEPKWAPEGKTVLQANILQYDEDYEYWKSLDSETYKMRKDQLAEEVMQRMVEKFPELEGQINLLDCWTPITYERYCNSYHGAYMGFITRKNVKSFRVKGTVKGIKNVYIASQWIQAPGGLPVAVTGGKFAIMRILKNIRSLS